MIKKIFNKLKKISSNIRLHYLKYLSLDVDDKLVLLEGGQGSNINGNMFSMLKELQTNPKWQNYTCVFVVTEKTIDKAKKRMNFYGFDNVHVVVRNSHLYCKYLATAKYLLTDNSFPPYFYKRDEQVFLNTWHGTPLKTLGHSDKSNLASLANIQKNYLMSDYALFPNEFTRNVFMDDYDLKNIFRGNSLIANYPRNYIFYDREQGKKIKQTLGLADKTVYAYMPTWRGTGRKADTEYQIETTTALLKEFDSKLDDNSVMLVNLHFLLAGRIDCENFSHIKYFPSDYDTYEVLNACDGLVTDYSSVFFDFAVTGKKIILFTYDKESYLSSRGVYLDFDTLPFPLTETVDETINEMNRPVSNYDDFINEYCTNGSVDICEKLFDLMVKGESSTIKLERNENAGKNVCLIYAGALPDTQYENINNYIKENPGYNYVIAYRRNFNKSSKEYVVSLDKNVSSFGIVSAFQFNIREFMSIVVNRKLGFYDDTEASKEFYSREARRLFYSFEPVKIVDFSCANPIIAGILSVMSGEKVYIGHGDYFCYGNRYAKKVEYVKKYEQKHNFTFLDMAQQENEAYIQRNEDMMADKSFRRNSCMKNILPLYIKSKNNMKCISFFTFKTPVKTKLSDLYITVGDSEKQYKPRFISRTTKESKHHSGIYSFDIPLKDVVDMPASNMVALCYKNNCNFIVKCHIVYSAFFFNVFLGLRGPMTVDMDTQTVAIFRQSRKNRLNIYVRSVNVSDKFIERFKQDVAFVLAFLWRSKKADKIVLLYEKNSSKYEESASVLFEKLIDEGYTNSYFIVDRNYEFIDRIPEKYRSNILYKYSFKHYLYFFRSKTFIGTEALVHAIDLKTFNILPLKKISSKNLNYVFLQHGVMYMVSLDSEARGMFKRKKLNGKYRVVVSSKAEADHFVNLGHHYPGDLYISGLPKFDRNYMSDTADKIVIMPTWRPWEINAAREDFCQTAYFKMVMRIYDCVPDSLKDKVVILPHPLIVNELKHLPKSIVEKMVLDSCYDDILKQTRLLITDYSSIAYDAFYRGSRVIFYWEEKDYCMSKYGPSTHLMMNEENVFGDVFYSTDNLSCAIEENYYNPQKQNYIDNYSKIVEFHDSKNTERLIGMLKQDNII